MSDRPTLVRAARPTPMTIECSLADHLLKDLPVSVFFLYERSVEPAALLSALGEVLVDFPLFAGTLRMVEGQLYIDCDNRGVSVSVVRHPARLMSTFERALKLHPSEVVDLIEPRRALRRQAPLFSLKITTFACGGMCLGLCWHHSLGDMHTFMCLMRAWTALLAGGRAERPLIVRKRKSYLAEHLGDGGSRTPGLRYLGGAELARFALYMALRARDREIVGFYFTDDELQTMKGELSRASGEAISTNDALSAHMFSQIAEGDPQPRSRLLGLPVNYRRRVGLPEGLLGNFVSSLLLRCEPERSAASIAGDLRRGLDRFSEEHLSSLADARLVEARGGVAKSGRFVVRSIDPVKGNLLITSWRKFGVYDLDFGAGRPLFFCSTGEAPFPWLSSTLEGFSNQGALFGAILPGAIAAALTDEGGRRAVHRYRDAAEPLPELVERSSWIH